MDSFASTPDHRVELSGETGLPVVVWGELIHDLSAEQDYTGLTSDSGGFDDESGLALSSQRMDKFLIDTMQTYDLSNASRVLSGTEFRLSAEVLQQLRDAGVPEDILQQLALLGEQGFSQEAIFWEAVENQIGRQQAQQYREAILGQAGRGGAPDGLITQTTPGYLTEQSLDNLDAWDALLYYPRVAQQAFAYQSQRSARRRSVDLLEEEEDLFDVLGFFKRWGIPKPVTIVILALVLYLLLSFLARR